MKLLLHFGIVLLLPKVLGFLFGGGGGGGGNCCQGSPQSGGSCCCSAGCQQQSSYSSGYSNPGYATGPAYSNTLPNTGGSYVQPGGTFSTVNSQYVATGHGNTHSGLLPLGPTDTVVTSNTPSHELQYSNSLANAPAQVPPSAYVEENQSSQTCHCPTVTCPPPPKCEHDTKQTYRDHAKKDRFTDDSSKSESDLDYIALSSGPLLHDTRINSRTTTRTTNLFGSYRLRDAPLDNSRAVRRAAAAVLDGSSAHCTNRMLQKVMQKSMVSSRSQSKERIAAATKLVFKEVFAVICSESSFSYKIPGEDFCETTQGKVTCLAFRI